MRDFKKVSASRAGNYQTLPAHHENYPSLADGQVLMSSPVQGAGDFISVVKVKLQLACVNTTYITDIHNDITAQS